MATLVSTNPAKNYEKLGEVEVSTEQEIQEAVKNARKANQSWATLPVSERLAYLQRFVDALKSRADEAAKLISQEMGKPISDAKGEVQTAIDDTTWIIENAESVLNPVTIREDENGVIEQHNEPYGVSAAIAAWNFPLTNFKECVLQDLAAGNTVVFKHSEENPLVGKLIDELMQTAEFPEGVFTQVYGAGEVGDILTDQDVDFISFIGSSKVGRTLYKKAAEKFINVRLEMGGSSPGIVFEDVDIETTARQVVSDRFFNTGQVCDAMKRLLVQESIYDEFISAVQKEVESLNFGSPDKEDVSVSCLVAERQVQPILDQINKSVEQGAEILVGGKKAKNMDGAYIEPTLITNVTENMPVWAEEVFGPVLPVMTFKDEAEAIKLANNTQYGLSGYVHTADKERAVRVAKEIKAGQIATNGVHNYYPEVCFGGYKASGIGRTCGPAGLLTGTQIKIITRLK
ncbi:MAG: aldehyde dehydrogenase [Candidatus Nomurabacteria bacterium]|nr:MAG: aldehyde dehydrogenase [Candidatus Nomurabacteria bacterium]